MKVIYITVYDVLKNELHWIDSMSATYEGLNSRDGWLSISFGLTPDAIKQTNAIIDITFSYIRQIKETGIMNWRFDEMKTMNDLILLKFKNNRKQTLKTSAAPFKT